LGGTLVGVFHAARRLGDITRDIFGDRRLLFNGGGDGVNDLRHLADDAGNALEIFHRAGGGRLDTADLGLDVLSGLGGLASQLLDLMGHHREPFARGAGARGLDGCVEGQEFRLIRNGGDRFGDLADGLGRLAQCPHGGCHLLGLVCGVRGDAARLLGVGGNLADRRGHFFGRAGDAGQVVDRAVHVRGHGDGAGAQLLGGRGLHRSLLGGRLHSDRTLLRGCGKPGRSRRNGLNLGGYFPHEFSKSVRETLHGSGQIAYFVRAVRERDRCEEVAASESFRCFVKVRHGHDDAPDDRPKHEAGQHQKNGADEASLQPLAREPGDPDFQDAVKHRPIVEKLEYVPKPAPGSFIVDATG
jgi:hypothetical protein